MAMKVKYTVLDGEIISENRGGTISDYVPDSLGSTRFLLNSSQTATDSWDYWPYGEAVHVTGTNPTPMQFVGTQGYYASNATKTYVRARLLEPQKARWLTEDPAGILVNGANGYSYAESAPTTYSDASGLQSRRSRNLCRGLRGFNSSGIPCTGLIWENRLKNCKGISNVKYCCQVKGQQGLGPGCVCLVTRLPNFWRRYLAFEC